MTHTIEKALEANKTAGRSERIIIDGVTFTRFPLHEAFLCVSHGLDNRNADVAKATEVAIQAKKLLETSGMTWDEIRKTCCTSDPFNSNVHGQIWSKYQAVLELGSNVFIHSPESNKGLWSIPDDYIAIYPREGTHFLVAEYFPTGEDVKYLKKAGFERYDLADHPTERSTYFLNGVNWDPDTMSGILKL